MSSLLPCSVCPLQTGAGWHYGAIVCLRCKAAFRRAVRQGFRPACALGGACRVTTNGRKDCRSCRFSRALAAGMDPRLVHSDRGLDGDAPLVLRKKRRSPAAFSCSSFGSEEASFQSTASPACFEIITSFEGPLGFRSDVRLPPRDDWAAVLRFLHAADRFVDDFSDTGVSHFSPDGPPPNLDLSLEEAFLYAPLRLSRRTKILLRPESWMTDDGMPQSWARSVLHYVDLVSHVPELRQLEADDRLKLLVGRGLRFAGVVVLQRTLRNTTRKCALMTGGRFLPLEDEELARFECDPTLASFIEMLRLIEDTLVAPVRALDLSDEEFLLHRMLALFTAGKCFSARPFTFRSVPKLSDAGREVVRKARAAYESHLVHFLTARLGRSAAIRRMSALLCVLPLVEQAAVMQHNFMARTSVAKKELGSRLVHDVYFAQF
ncbi:hypothetical protein M3Y99_00466500 [Aphelenchoides fujianensis]|nr:hypothetical protein M3Y99_00466500 [Aphelenchoides fujianensis]